MSETSDVKWVVSIEKWATWHLDSQTSVQPDISFVDASMRRKLSLLTKMSLKVAHECAGHINNVRTVYASRHGDLIRTTKMMQHMAIDEMLSPTAFSLSVLNASMGVYSIIQKDVMPAIAISASESSFGLGLLEAYLQLASNPHAPVLFVYADDAPPVLYNMNEENSFMPHAIGLLLTSEASLKVECVVSDVEVSAGMDGSTNALQSLTFLECLNHHKTASWCVNNKRWDWQYVN